MCDMMTIWNQWEPNLDDNKIIDYLFQENSKHVVQETWWVVAS